MLRPPKVIRCITRSILSKLIPKRPMIFLVIEDVNKVLQQASEYLNPKELLLFPIILFKPTTLLEQLNLNIRGGYSVSVPLIDLFLLILLGRFQFPPICGYYHSYFHKEQNLQSTSLPLPVKVCHPLIVEPAEYSQTG